MAAFGPSAPRGDGDRNAVVSEPIYRPEPFVAGTHYVSAPAEELPEVIRYYLEHEDERAAIAREGQRFATQELTFERSVRVLLERLG